MSRDRIDTGGSGSTASILRDRTNTGGSVDYEAGISASEMVRLKKSPSRSSGSLLNQQSPRRRKMVDWIQQHRTRRSPTNPEGVPLISGLDRVLFGTLSAADAISIAGVKPPRYLWYMVSGAMCDVIQFTTDILLHVSLEIKDASLCWALGFIISIIFRHTSHRYLVFGDYVGGYWASLGRMYAGYSVIIVLSTIFNILMTRMADFSHYFAWILTLLWTGIANYFILKKLWSFGGAAGGSGSKS